MLVTYQCIACAIQVVTAASLQAIAKILIDSRYWAYYVAFDAETNHVESYTHVQIRLCTGAKLEIQHVLAIPLREKHTGENMFNIVNRLFGAVGGSDWNKKVVGISTDVAA